MRDVVTYGRRRGARDKRAKTALTWDALSSYLRTTLTATLRPVMRSIALYTFEKAPLRGCEEGGKGGRERTDESAD